jgi:hypothetical protein
MKKLLLAFLILSCLIGCATPPVSLSKEAQSNISRVDGLLTITQNNLDVTVPATNPGNTGLIGALVIMAIDSSRRSSAEAAAAPLFEVLRDYDFREVMLGALTNALVKTDPVKFSLDQHVEVITSDSAKRIAFDRSSASAIFFCDTGYRLESGNLIVTVGVEMYPKTEALMAFRYKADENNPLARGNVIYKKSFSILQRAVTPGSIKANLTEAAEKLSHHIATDLNHGI